MDKPVYDHKCEKRYPHGKDVLERDHSENGFAAGWSMHAKPVPDYYFDCHIHYDGAKGPTVAERIAVPMGLSAEAGAERVLLIIQVYGKKWQPTTETDTARYFTADELKTAVAGLSDDKRIFWGPYIRYGSPEPELVHLAADLGASYVKLHNSPQIVENAPADLWLGRQWRETFKAIAERGLPVLWHVTQRLPGSAYTGGGRNTYWQKGWEAGVAYNNEDLLTIFLTCCRHFPDIKFIGAHQLHIGWDRLDGLFAGYPNLYVDTTIGCQLLDYDDFYEHDKAYLRDMFIRRADRILYGTDTFWGKNDAINETVVRRHMRFILKLDLPEDVLNPVCHGNAERLIGVNALRKSV